MAKVDTKQLAIGVLALGAIGIGGYIALKMLGGCTEGTPRCENGVSQVCHDNAWVDEGNYCNSGCQSLEIGKPCSVAGSHKCDSGCYLLCNGDSWTDTGQGCTTAACGVIPCSSSKSLCVGDDLFFKYYCDPIDADCEPSEVQLSSPACVDRTITSAKIWVNNQATEINGVPMPYSAGCAGYGTCSIWGISHHYCEELDIRVRAFDNLGQGLEGALVSIDQISSADYGGFEFPSNPGTLYCAGPVALTTDSNGYCIFHWVRTVENQTASMRFRATITDGFGNYVQSEFVINLVPTSSVYSESCQYYESNPKCSNFG